MHLCDVLTGHGFDYEAVVVAGQEAVAKATLGVAVEWGAPRQRVLPKIMMINKNAGEHLLQSRHFKLPKIPFALK